MRKPQCARNQKREYAVDSRRVKHHRHAQIFGVRNHPLFVLVDRAFEFFERIYRLTESFHNGDSANVFHRLVRHIFKRVVILFHLFRHALARHRRHNQKRENYGNEAQKPQTPIEYKQQCKQTYRRCDRRIFVGQLMREIVFRRARRIVYYFPEFSAAETIDVAKRKFRYMLRRQNSHISGNPKRRKVRTKQREYVN